MYETKKNIIKSFLETITPRESSDDTENNKTCEGGTSTDPATVDKTVKNVIINTQSVENVQGNENRSSITIAADKETDEEAGAVGGDDDDSVFMDEAIPSTSITIAQLPSHRISIDNTSSKYAIIIITIIYIIKVCKSRTRNVLHRFMTVNFFNFFLK